MQKFVIAATLTCAGILGSTGASAAQLSGPFNFRVAGDVVPGTMTYWDEIAINSYESGAVGGLWNPPFIPDQTAAALNAQVEDEIPTRTGGVSLFAFPRTSASDQVTSADVPEPANLALMGLALSSMALAIRRRPRP